MNLQKYCKITKKDTWMEFSLAQEETIETFTYLLLSHEVSCEDDNSKNRSPHCTTAQKISKMFKLKG